MPDPISSENQPSPKTALRKQLRMARTARATGTAFAMPESVADALVNALADAEIIASYWPVGSEASPLDIATKLHTLGKTIVLPIIHADDHLSFHRWAPEMTMVAGAHNIPVPAHVSAPLTPEAFLVPLLGFDDKGNRLGQGKGHYDRAFEAFPKAQRIGIAWGVQQCPLVPTDPWDVPLHAIATDKDWITP